jgi:tRNA (guanine37-N1)-methyltransferase
VIGDVESALSDSFQDNLLEPPVYTRPAEYHPVDNPEETWTVPEILLSGHEAKIKEWEYEQALARTKKLRPDLLDN